MTTPSLKSTSPKTAKLVPRLRFPEFEGEWDKQTLDYLCEIFSGGTPSTTNEAYWNGEIQWITPMEMGKSTNPYIQSTQRTLTEDGLKNCSSPLLPIDAVILSTRAPIGHLARNSVPMAMNQGCRALVSKGKADNTFIYFILDHVKQLLENLGSGNTFKELSKKDLSSFSIPLPTLPEQQKIADCLSSLDDLITAESAKLEALKEHKKGLMQQLFPREGETTPRLRFPEFEGSGEWEVKRLGEVCKSLDAGVSVNAENRPAQSDEIGVLKTSCVFNGVFYKEENKAVVSPSEIARVRESVQANTIIFSRMNTPALVGASAYIAQNHDNLFLPDRLWAIKPNTGISMRFLANFLTSDQGQQAISGLATGTSGSMKNIAKSSLLNLFIPIPSFSEQQRICDTFSVLDIQIIAQTRQIETLQAHKKGLMQQLFPVMEG